MKKKHTILFIALMIASLGVIATWFAFTTQPDNFSRAPLTTIEIPRDSINLKTIRYDEQPQATFTLKNTGTHPLLIKDVLTTCGCTNPQWEKRPVLPGQTREIIVTFKPNSLGRLTKTIQVLCNTRLKLHDLKLEGFVTE